MTDDDKRAQARYPAALRVKLKYPDVQTFIQKYASNISEGGIFVASKNLPAIGTQLRFEFLLASSDAMTSIIRGTGEVKWLRTVESKAASQQTGMGIEFTELDEESRNVIKRALAYRAQSGGEAAALAPMPAPHTIESIPPTATRITRKSDVSGLYEMPASPSEAAKSKPAPPAEAPPSHTPTPPISRSMAARDLAVIARESGISTNDINDILTRYDSRPLDFSKVEKFAADDETDAPISKQEALARLRELLK